ncbi:MAG: ATP-grasp domain-containing protein [Proteobacteria bacterium]|nr:ATP-grasp domain-containing protein [Pseudomonadota bacterium]MDA0951701.1 ATP-grasp domain-containing protein [Pseudomonadota bacterium]
MAEQGQVSSAATIAAVTVELQRMFGDLVSRAVVGDIDDAGACVIACEIEQEVLGSLALRAAMAMVAHAVARAARRPEALDSFIARAEAEARDSATAAIVLGARERGIPARRLHQGHRFVNHVRFSHGRYQRQAISTITDGCSAVAGSVTGSKSQTVLLLRRLGLPVPHQFVAASAKEARTAGERIGYPVVVKPDRGTGGAGITADVRDETELDAAFGLATSYSSTAVVEEMIPGEDHRMLVCGGRMVAATQRRRAAVVGDGRTTIAALIAAENANPRRGPAGQADLVTIKPDAAMRTLLARDGLDLRSVPPAGHPVLLRTTANMKLGGSVVAVDDIVHPDNQRLAEAAALGLGLDIAGVDLLIPDIAVSYLDQPCAIVEVNMNPGLAYGSFPDVFPRVIDGVLGQLFAPGETATMPLVAVVGSAQGQGPATVAALVRGFALAGRCAAWFDGHDLGIGCAIQQRGVAEVALAADMILGQPLAEAGVLLCEARHLLRRGLPWETCDTVVFADGAAAGELDFVVAAAGGRSFQVGDAPEATAAAVIGALGLGAVN